MTLSVFTYPKNYNLKRVENSQKKITKVIFEDTFQRFVINAHKTSAKYWSSELWFSLSNNQGYSTCFAISACEGGLLSIMYEYSFLLVLIFMQLSR